MSASNRPIFTPGPWFVSEMHKDEVYCSRDGYFELVCETSGNADNARLIAAAPELFDALQDAEFILRKLAAHPSDVRSMLDSLRRSAEDARAALAKAEGKA